MAFLHNKKNIWFSVELSHQGIFDVYHQHMFAVIKYENITVVVLVETKNITYM